MALLEVLGDWDQVIERENDGVRELAEAVKRGVDVFVDRLPDLNGTG